MSKAPSFLSPESVIVGFYGLLNDKKHAEAFDCLTPAFQTRMWAKRGGLESFIKGYDSLQDISRLVCAPIDHETAQYHVYYHDHIHHMHYPLLDPLAGLQDQEARNTTDNKKRITEFKEFMVGLLKADPELTDAIHEDQFFSKTNVEDCCFLGNAQYTGENKKYFTYTDETHLQYRRAICVNGESGWKIDALRYQ